MRTRSAKLRLAIATLVAVSFHGGAHAEAVQAVEYYHKAFEHYFVSVDPAEIAALDGGTVQGWWRTGIRYRADSAPGPELQPVCRFYTEAFAGKASHFFTASARECAAVKANPNWRFEGIPFYVQVPDWRGECTGGTAPVYRLYNNGMGGAPNHAYVPDMARRAALGTAGWVGEGVAFCVPSSAAEPAEKTAKLAGTTWELPVPAEAYGVTHTRTRFASEITTDGRLASQPDNFGRVVSPIAIYHQSSEAWWGTAAFEPLSGRFIIMGSSGFEPEPVVGIAWELDDADGPTSPACAMVVRYNVVASDGFSILLHPFQPYLWSGCESGVATKME